MVTVNFSIKVTNVKQGERLAKKYIHDQTKKLFKDCVRHFIITATEAMVQHIDTGMSIASFRPLAGKLRIAQLLETQLSNRKRLKSNRYFASDPQFSKGSGSLKSAALGVRLGKDAYRLEVGTVTNPKMIFEFSIPVLQFYLHENGLAGYNSHHWNALRKGREAFIAYWRTYLPQYVKSAEIVKIIKTGKYVATSTDLDGDSTRRFIR